MIIIFWWPCLWGTFNALVNHVTLFLCTCRYFHFMWVPQSNYWWSGTLGNLWCSIGDCSVILCLMGLHMCMIYSTACIQILLWVQVDIMIVQGENTYRDNWRVSTSVKFCCKVIEEWDLKLTLVLECCFCLPIDCHCLHCNDYQCCSNWFEIRNYLWLKPQLLPLQLHRFLDGNDHDY